jgi:TRAP-type C4-dicarboxylate transport system substrate-binding protein
MKTVTRHLMWIGALALAAGVTGEAAAKTLRYAEFGPNRGSRAATLKWFAKQVEKRSGGDLKIQFHWGKSLLGTKAVLKGVGDGVADMGSVIAFFNPKKLRTYNIADLPVKNSDVWVGMRAVYRLATTNPAFTKQFDANNVVYITNYSTGPIELICTKKVTTLADLKGTKVRASGPYGKTLADIGASVQRLPQPKVYQALDTGLITCNQNYWYSILAYKQYEVARYATELDWGQNMGFGIIMNKRTWAGLSDKQKSVIRSVGSDFIDHYAQVMITSAAKQKAKMMKGIGGKKLEVVEMKPADRAKLLEAGTKYVKAWVAAATKDGLDGKGIMADYQAAIDKYAKAKAEKGYPWTRK